MYKDKMSCKSPYLSAGKKKKKNKPQAKNPKPKKTQ